MKYYTYILILLVIACKNDNDSAFKCSYEKALISDKDFFQNAIDKGEPGIPIGHPFDFDSLVSLDQIDTLKSELCKGDCSGYISLKYSYRKDTVYIPAFFYICNDCHVVFTKRDKFNLLLRNDSCFYRENIGSYKPLTEKAFSDSLSQIFSSTFENTFKIWNQRKPFLNNTDSLIEYRRSGLYTPSLFIELYDDSQIQNIKKYINKAFDIYLQEIHDKMKEEYHADLCKLSRLEFKLMSFDLFFRVEIMGRYKPPIFIAPYE
jgi:hypothetical protein